MIDLDQEMNKEEKALYKSGIIELEIEELEIELANRNDFTVVLYDKYVEAYARDKFNAEVGFATLISDIPKQKKRLKYDLEGYVRKCHKMIDNIERIAESKGKPFNDDLKKKKSDLKGFIYDLFINGIGWIELRIHTVIQFLKITNKILEIYEQATGQKYNGYAAYPVLQGILICENIAKVEYKLKILTNIQKQIITKNYPGELKRYKDLSKKEQLKIAGTGGRAEDFAKAKTKKWFFELYHQEDGCYKRNGKPYFCKIDQELIKRHEADPESDGKPSLSAMKDHRRKLALMNYHF